MQAGLLSEDRLKSALAIQREHGGYLADVLVTHGFIDEASLLRFWSERQGAQYITAEKLSKARLDDAVLDRLAVRRAEQLCALPLRYDGYSDTLHVAVPEIESTALESIREAARVGRLNPILATRAAIRAGIKRFYYHDVYAFAALEATNAVARVANAQSQVVARSRTPQVGLAPVSAEPVTDRRPTPLVITPIKLLNALDSDEPTQRAIAPLQDDTLPAGTTLPPGTSLPSMGDTAPDHKVDLAARLDELARENKMLRVANALMHHLARERNVHEIYHRVLAFAFDNLPADEGVLMVRKDDAWVPAAVRTRDGSGVEVQVSATLLREVQSSRQGVMTTDAAFDPRFRNSETVARIGLRSAMGVPLIVEGEVRAVLVLSSRSRIAAFSSDDLDLLTTIAAQTAVGIENALLTRKLGEDAAKRERLSRFMSPALVEMATSGALELGEHGELQEATILFADIRGFTTLSERLSPAEVVALLNEHFEAMVEVVFKHGGILDKFLGDALMALWGVPNARAGDASRAVSAALEMVKRVREMNELRRAQGRQTIEIGVGINTGMVVFGAMGASKRHDLTAVGDAVNTASRLCAMAEAGQIIAAESTIGAAKGAFTASALAPVLLKGKSREVVPYVVNGT